MRKRLLFSMLFAVAAISHAADEVENSCKGPLNGLVVIIDPGHGGLNAKNETDTGTFIKYRGKMVTEADFVWSVAVELDRLLFEKCALPLFTVEKIGGQLVYAGGNTLVHSDHDGLRARSAFGDKISEALPGHRIVWVSIHFDSLSKLFEGVRIIKGEEGGDLAKAFLGSFAKSKYFQPRKEFPVLLNGDSRIGRPFVVLREYIGVPKRIMLELGNIQNRKDVGRLLDPLSPERCARAILNALLSMN